MLRSTVRNFRRTVVVAVGRQLQSSSTRHVIKSIAAVAGVSSVGFATRLASQHNNHSEAKASHIDHPEKTPEHKTEISEFSRVKSKGEVVCPEELALILRAMKDKQQQYELIRSLEPELKLIFNSQDVYRGTVVTETFKLFDNHLQQIIFSTLGYSYVDALLRAERNQVIQEAGKLTCAKLIAIMGFAGVFTPENFSMAKHLEFDSRNPDTEALGKMLEVFQSHYKGKPYLNHAAFVQALIDNADKASAIYGEFTSKEWMKKPLSEKLTAKFIESLAAKVSENRMAPSNR